MNDITDPAVFKPQTDSEKRARAVAWTTEDEIEFVGQIGSSLWPQNLPRPRELRKSKLIGNYIEAAKRRTDWGQIDAIKVIEYAQKRMAYEAQVEKEQGWK